MERTTDMNDVANAPQPPKLHVSRTFHAPRETVFAAWSSAEHVKRWYSPETYSVPDATVDMRVGGAFDVCMRSPEGHEHWMRGTFVVVSPHDRLAIEARVVDAGGFELFRALTDVRFADVLGGTRMDVVQTYTFRDPAIALPFVSGASEGWRTTLDKLEIEVARANGATGAASVP